MIVEPTVGAGDGVEAALAALANEFQVERDYRCAAFPSVEDTDPKKCRYCQKTRQTYAGCTLDGHAKCLVSVAFMDRMFRVMHADPRLSYGTVAHAFGLTVPVVRGWFMAAWKRSGRC